MTTPQKIPPVLILSTGRCGSTMVSEMLSRHPRVLSLSEFFMPLGPHAFAWPRPDGDRMWRTYREQCPALHASLKDGIVMDECLYPHTDPGSRFRAATMPPILIATLPHLTPDYEALYDELEPVVRAAPRQPLADQYRLLFGHLAQKFQRDVWIERSGGSLMLGAKLLRLFPDARVIHVYRDGRDTAMSMSKHHNFRVLIGAMRKARRFGIDPAKEFLSPKGSRLDVLLQSLIFPRLDIQKMVNAQLSLADFGTYWNELILVGDRLLRDLPPERLLKVKFEDVQASPRAKLRELIRFIDPSLENDAWLDEVSAIPRPARSHFGSLPPDERRALEAACAPGLDVLGYSR